MLTPPDYLFDFCIVHDKWCSGFTFNSVAADPLRPDQKADILQTTFSNALSLNKCWCLHSRISLIFVPEGLIDKYWTNCERTIPVVKGNLPGAAQYRPKGNCISVWFWHIYIYVHRKHTFDKPHPWNRRSIYFNRSIAALRPMKTRRGSDKDVFRSLKCSCHSGARVEVTNPIFSVPLFFQFFKNYKNTGYLHDIMFIVWKLLQQLSCGDT